MGFFDFITGSAKSVENVTEIGNKITTGVISGLDMLIFTDEEKTQYSAKAGELFLAFWKTFGTENSEQSRARRDLAKMTFNVFFSLILMGVAVYGFNEKYGMFIFKIAESIKWLVVMVAGAYFIPHQLAKVYTKKE